MRDPAQSEGVSPPAGPTGVGFAPIDAARAPKIPAPTQSVDFYKRHSLAARNWGAIGGSGGALREVSAEEARDTFLKNLLDTPTTRGARSPVHWFVSVTLQALVVAAVVIVPLLFTQGLDSTNLQATYLAVPPPPSPPPPPPSKPDLPARHAFRRVTTPTITMPTMIPRRIAEVKTEDAPDIGGGPAAGTVGGVEGGVLGGVIGGIAGGPPPPPPPPAAKRKGIQQVGGDVKAPRLISSVDPVYSPVARVAKIEGTVVIDAVIDEHGDVVQARAISGPPLLIPSALQAVLKRKYEPTYLDGMAVPIEMRVEVGFHLH